MRHLRTATALFLALTAGAAHAQAPINAPAGIPIGFPQFPSISPDGGTIVFSWRGDLWSLPTPRAGEPAALAQRLTAHPAAETRSALSPDGTSLAFESERDGARNLYIAPVLRIEGQPGRILLGEVRRVTMSDRSQALAAFSANGTELYFTGQHEPSIFRASRMYAAPIPPLGSETILPLRRLTDAFGTAARPSPDGSSIVFHRTRLDPTRPIYQGSGAPDVFSMNMSTGAFTQLTNHPRSDAEAFVAKDGSVIFNSSRSGQFNLYRVPNFTANQDQAAVALTTFAPQGDPDSGSIGHGVRDFSLAANGSVGVFCVWDTLYTIDVTTPGSARAIPLLAGGEAAEPATTRLTPGRAVNTAALSPDGKTLATIARGEVFVRSIEKDRPTRRVTMALNADHAAAGTVRARELAWSPDGASLYFSADAPNTNGAIWLFEAKVDQTRDQLRTDAKPNSKADPKADAKPEPKAETKPEPEPAKDEAADAEPKADAAKPDAAKPEPTRRRPAGDPGARWADAVTFTIAPLISTDGAPAADLRDPKPSPDGRWLLATRGLGDLVLIDLAKLRAADPASTRVIVPSWSDTDAAWAADSRHIVYSATDVNYNSDIFLLDALAEPAVPINLTRHPDEDAAPRLSADGKVLYFLSDRDSDTNGQFEVFSINLDKKLDGLRPYELADYYKDAAEAARKRKPLPIRPARTKDAASATTEATAETKPEAAADAPAEPAEAKAETKPEPKPETKPEATRAAKPFAYDPADLTSAYLRVRKVPSLPERVSTLAITPAGDRIIVAATADGSPSLASFDHLGKDRKVIFPGGASDVSLSLTGDRVVFVSSGRAEPAGATPQEDRPRGVSGEPYLGRPAGGEAEKLPIEGSIAIDLAAQQTQKFLDASRLMGARFYHPTMKGRDWPALASRYLSLARNTRGNDEFNRIFNMLLGELDASHMGMSGGGEPSNPSPNATAIGSLGVDATQAPGGYRITRVVPNGPADRPISRLAVGDLIRAINTRPLALAADAQPTLDLHAALANTAGTETLLDLDTPAGPKRVLITPISSASETTLRYRAEVERNAARVAELSNGNLGYLHIRGMDMASARDFERDLFAAADGKRGLIIDVRDNGGGSTADILLSALTAPRHARTFAKGMDMATLPKDAYPRDRRLIYAYTRPIVVLINQNSFSNAEIFAHAIKTINRGRLVGIATYGGVISTGSATLIDGTTMRTPFRGWLLPGDIDMENNGAEPDLNVPQTPEDEAKGQDRQLEAAVQDLLATTAREAR